MSHPIHSKVESAKNKDAWNYFINQPSKEWLSYDQFYNTSNNSIKDSPLIRKYIFNGNKFSDMINASLSSACVALSFPIAVYTINNDKTITYNGQTNYIIHPTTRHIGLASFSSTVADRCNQSSSNYVNYVARHDFSYDHEANDYNRVRCLRTCWNGSENYYEAIQWFVR